MAATPEVKVKKQVKAVLEQLGAYYFFPVANGYTRAGIPDIIVCYRGRFIGIEVKAGKNVPTALQERELSLIRKSGGAAYVINEKNISLLATTLQSVGTAADD